MHYCLFCFTLFVCLFVCLFVNLFVYLFVCFVVVCFVNWLSRTLAITVVRRGVYRFGPAEGEGGVNSPVVANIAKIQILERRVNTGSHFW